MSFFLKHSNTESNLLSNTAQLIDLYPSVQHDNFIQCPLSSPANLQPLDPYGSKWIQMDPSSVPLWIPILNSPMDSMASFSHSSIGSLTSPMPIPSSSAKARRSSGVISEPKAASARGRALVPRRLRRPDVRKRRWKVVVIQIQCWESPGWRFWKVVDFIGYFRKDNQKNIPKFDKVLIYFPLLFWLG